MAERVDRIHKITRNGKTGITYYPVVVIGAGPGGLAMGCRLQQVLGCDQYRIFDRKAGIGGTWYINTYPGVACDVPAIVYSFSFAQNPTWTQPFPSGGEILQYLEDVSKKFDLYKKIQLNTSVKEARWIEADKEWELIIEVLAEGIGDLSTVERRRLEEERGRDSVVLSTETIRAKVVCSGVGGLVEPKYRLNVEGIESFEGEIMHTARWNHKFDFRDKEVVVVGTGCTAAQVVPALIKPEYGAKKVTQLMRTPPWVTPLLTGDEREKAQKQVAFVSQTLGLQKILRVVIFLIMEMSFFNFFSMDEKSSKRRKAKAQELLAHMHKTVPEKYHEILTPDYEPFCKRRVIDNGWYESFQDPRIDITTLPLTKVQAKSVTLGPGRHYPPMSKTDSKAPTDQRQIRADVIVMAHGFDTNQYLHPLKAIGRNGVDMWDLWAERGGPQAYMGLAVDHFPNFFMLGGPNTATGHTSIITSAEGLINYSLKLIKPILKGETETWEIKETAQRQWTTWIHQQLKNTVFGGEGGCKSWYSTAGGWNSTMYPRNQYDFGLRCMFPRYSDWTAQYTSKGLSKQRLHLVLKTIALTTTFAGVVLVLFGARVPLSSTNVIDRGMAVLKSQFGTALRAVGITSS